MDWRKELTGYLEKDEEIPANMVEEWAALPLNNLDELLEFYYDVGKMSNKMYDKYGKMRQYFDVALAKGKIRQHFNAALAKFILAIAADKGEEGIKCLFEYLDKEPLKRIIPITEIELAELILLRYIVEDNGIYALFEKMTLAADDDMQEFIKCLLGDGSGDPNISNAKNSLCRKMELKKVIDKVDLLSDDIIADEDAIYDALDKWYDDNKHYYISEVIEQIPEKKWSRKLVIEYVCACNNTNAPKEAIECLKKFDSLGNESGIWHYLHGYALYLLKQHENAISEFKRSLEIDPTWES